MNALEFLWIKVQFTDAILCFVPAAWDLKYQLLIVLGKLAPFYAVAFRRKADILRDVEVLF